jgi:AraC family transcriptional regulator
MRDRRAARADRSVTAGDSRLEYEKRVNRVVDHVQAHLAEELSLPALARIAAFSPFHFHRVFKATTGETLFGFIQRLRLERAANALWLHPDESVLAVALDHGFSSAATFARAFRAYFGMSATEWRAGGGERWRAAREPERNHGKQVSKTGKARRARESDTARRRREEGRMSIRVSEFPPQRVAYMRYVGPYGAAGIPELWTRLVKWMATRDFTVEATTRLGIGHDNPSVTAPERCRYDACVVVPRDFAPDRRVNVMDVPGGRYAAVEFVGTAHEIEPAWNRMFSSWLPGSGWEPDDRPCFEVYRGNPSVSGRTGAVRCDLCLPVRPL